jgi:hypothetical protein
VNAADVIFMSGSVLLVLLTWRMTRCYAGQHRVRVIVLALLCALLALLTATTLETRLDALSHPVASGMLLRNLLALLLAGVYLRTLKHTFRVSTSRFRPFMWLLYTGVAGSLVIGLIAWLHLQELATQRYALRVMRDGMLLVPTLAVFLPASQRLFRKEQSVPMKLKHAGYVCFFASFAAYALVSIFIGVAATHDLALANALSAALAPLGWLFVPGVIMMLVPHHILIPVLIPAQVTTFVRLRTLEFRIRRKLVARHSLPPVLWFEPFSMQVYLSVLFVLDCYLLLDTFDPTRQAIDTILADVPDYPEIRDRLSRLKTV